LDHELVEGPLILDGGLATQLEVQGADLRSALWSARLLADDPDAIVAAHRAYFAAGAQFATTASYQASLAGFAGTGLGRSEAEGLIRRSVELAQRARSDYGDDRSRWIAGSVGPYGAALADGSEYRGDYGVSVAELREWHRPRIALLAEAGADLLALETIPCLAEVEALLAEVAGTGVPCWLSLTCAGDQTRAGEPASEAFAMVGDVAEVVAVGVNCLDPADALSLVREAAEASGRPAVVYPNSGEQWDADARAWSGSPSFAAKDVQAWVEAGARLIGGCCRVGPSAIAAISTIIGEQQR
jgi:homocysteine S-methyltransferase